MHMTSPKGHISCYSFSQTFASSMLLAALSNLRSLGSCQVLQAVNRLVVWAYPNGCEGERGWKEASINE